MSTQELTSIKKRIKSVTGAYKVTSAMKLVSTVKLKSWRNKMISNRDFTNEISKVTDILFTNIENVNSPFIDNVSKNNKKLFVIVSSTLGLCGAYNNNIFKVAEANIKEDDDAIILGKKAITHFKDGKFNKIDGFDDYSSINDTDKADAITNLIIKNFIDGTYKEIHFVSSSYVNPLVFKAVDTQILPLNYVNNEIKVGYEPIFEPSKEELINTLTPFYIKNIIYSKLLESEVCEQASRSNAMENATNNAEEILDKLKIEFNKARQGAITQELIEIVAAANAI